MPRSRFTHDRKTLSAVSGGIKTGLFAATMFAYRISPCMVPIATVKLKRRIKTTKAIPAKANAISRVR